MKVHLIDVDPNERRLLTYTFIAHAVSDAWHILYPSLLFLIAVDYENLFFLAVLANVVIASRALAGVLAGIISDRYNARILYAAFAILSAAGSFMAAAPWGPVGLAAGLFVLGVGTGIYHPVGLAAIGRNIRQKAPALGIHEMGGLVGLGILPIAIVSIGVRFGWEWGFVLAGFLSLIPLVTLFLAPKEFDHPPKAESRQTVSLKEVVRLFTQKKVMGIYLTAAFLETSQMGFTTFLTLAIADIGGFGERTFLQISITALYLSFTILIGSPGSLLGGRLGDKFSPVKVLTVLSLVPIPFLILMGMTTGALWLALAAVIRFPFTAMSPLVNTMIAQQLPGNTQGKAYAISYGLGPIIAALVALLAGVIAEAHGVEWVFPLMAVFLIPASLSALLMLGSSKEERIANKEAAATASQGSD
ncbi:MAG: MFS transporter [Chloroflexi bacterium]|nr:MFS transporter [Chloroflexota bacterium]